MTDFTFKAFIGEDIGLQKSHIYFDTEECENLVKEIEEIGYNVVYNEEDAKFKISEDFEEDVECFCSVNVNINGVEELLFDIGNGRLSYIYK